MFPQVEGKTFLEWYQKYLEKHLVKHIDLRTGKLVKDEFDLKYTPSKIKELLYEASTGLSEMDKLLPNLKDTSLEEINKCNNISEKISKNLKILSNPEKIMTLQMRLKKWRKKQVT